MAQVKEQSESKKRKTMNPLNNNMNDDEKEVKAEQKKRKFAHLLPGFAIVCLIFDSNFIHP